MSGVLAVIQARLGSSRFPRKALADLCGKPVIARVVDAVSQVRGLDGVCVVTPFRDVRAIAEVVDVPVLGWEDLDDNDVLGRYARVAEKAVRSGTDALMRVTGDCPLFDPGIAENVLRLFKRSGCVYASNLAEGYVDGTDCEVFTVEAACVAGRCAVDSSDREHVTPWMRREYQMATLLPDRPSILKTSIDTEEDLERVRGLWVMR